MAPSATTITETYASIILNKESLIPKHSYQDGTKKGKELVHHTLRERIKGIDPNTCEAGEEDTFFVGDMGEVYRQHLRWKMNLKRVKPHYGMYLLQLSPNIC